MTHIEELIQALIYEIDQDYVGFMPEGAVEYYTRKYAPRFRELIAEDERKEYERLKLIYEENESFDII